MPVYAYRAMTRTGQEVKNRVEDVNRLSLIRKLKRNNLIPISVTQLNLNKSKTKRKRNTKDIETIKKISSTQLSSHKRKITLKERVSLVMVTGERITRKGCSNFYAEFLFAKKS